jgi:predicted dehydrogenase
MPGGRNVTGETRGETRKARIGVIGAGWWVVQNHLPILHQREDVTLAGVCRLGPAELEDVRARFGFPFATEDFRALLDHQPLDGVVVGSPHVAHYEHARAALERGLHVMVEKPLTTSAADARALVALAREQGVQILIPHGWNFRPVSREARRLVREGAIGEVRHVALQMASALRDLFAGRPLAGTETAVFRPPASTWADPARAGGYGWGQLCHALGLLFRVADLAPARVFALMGESATGADFYDALSVRFANGATGAISGSGTVPKSRGFQVDLRLFGTEGMLLLDLEEGRERLEVWPDRRDGGSEGRGQGGDEDAPATVYPTRPGDGLYECVEPVERFVDLCLGRPAENDAPGEVGLRAVEVLDAAYRSARSGRLEDV